jgi:hypothetical protein
MTAEIVARLERTFSQDAVAEFEDRIREAEATGVSQPRKPGEPLKYPPANAGSAGPAVGMEEVLVQLARTESMISGVAKRLMDYRKMKLDRFRETYGYTEESLPDPSQTGASASDFYDSVMNDVAAMPVEYRRQVEGELDDLMDALFPIGNR